MPAKRIWAEQLPTELPCKKKILAKAIKKIQAQSCAPQNSGSKPSAALGVRQRKKTKKQKSAERGKRGKLPSWRQQLSRQP